MTLVEYRRDPSFVIGRALQKIVRKSFRQCSLIGRSDDGRVIPGSSAIRQAEASV
jgi:hypothetical protein